MKGAKLQRGMTGIGMLSILALCGFLLVIVVKLVPAYLEGFKVNSALEGLVSDSRVEGASDSQVKELILKKLQVDDVDSVNAKHISIVSEAGKRRVSIEYERRIPMMGNVDAVVVFRDKSVLIGN